MLRSMDRFAQRSPAAATDDLILSELHFGVREELIKVDIRERADEVEESSEDETDNAIASRARSDLRSPKRWRQDVTKRGVSYRNLHYSVHHGGLSSLKDVGQQLWSGAFLLCEYLLTCPRPATLLELGAGLALPSIIGARHADAVFATDFNHAALELSLKNVEQNAHTIGDAGVVRVRKLDWLAVAASGALTSSVQLPAAPCVDPAQSSQAAPLDRQFEWSHSDLERIQSLGVYYGTPRKPAMHSSLPLATRRGSECDERSSTSPRGLIIGADLIYDDGLTAALFKTLTVIMSMVVHSAQQKLAPSAACAPSSATAGPLLLPDVVLAMELRFNFEAESLSIRAHGYRRFLSYLCQDSCHWSLADTDGGLAVAAHGGISHTSSPASESALPGAVVAMVCPSCGRAADTRCNLTQHSTTTSALNAPASILFAARQIDISSIPSAVSFAGYTRDAKRMQLWQLRWLQPR